MGEFAYELELPHHMHMKHQVFHTSQLKRCRLDADHPERVEPPRGLARIVDKPGLELDKILSYRTTGIGCHMKREYLVRWKKKIAKYERKIPRQSGLSRATMISSGGGCNTLRSLGDRARVPSSTKCD